MYTDDTRYEVSSFAIWSFIETLLEEARQETKEKCAKKAFDFADNLEKKT